MIGSGFLFGWECEEVLLGEEVAEGHCESDWVRIENILKVKLQESTWHWRARGEGEEGKERERRAWEEGLGQGKEGQKGHESFPSW